MKRCCAEKDETRLKLFQFMYYARDICTKLDKNGQNGQKFDNMGRIGRMNKNGLYGQHWIPWITMDKIK